MDAEDKERIARIEERTRGLPEWMARQSGRVERLERDETWIKGLMGMAWMAIVGLFSKKF